MTKYNYHFVALVLNFIFHDVLHALLCSLLGFAVVVVGEDRHVPLNAVKQKPLQCI